MNEPNVIVTIRLADTGGFTAELFGHSELLWALDFGSLLDRIRELYRVGGVEGDEDDVADESFDRDLEDIIVENRELLMRLARSDTRRPASDSQGA